MMENENLYRLVDASLAWILTVLSLLGVIYLPCSLAGASILTGLVVGAYEGVNWYFCTPCPQSGRTRYYLVVAGIGLTVMGVFALMSWFQCASLACQAVLWLGLCVGVCWRETVLRLVYEQVIEHVVTG